MSKNRPRQPARRKKTKAENRKTTNRTRLAKEHQKVEQALKNLGSWEEVEATYREAAGLLAQATSIHQLLKNSNAYIDHVADRTKFVQLAEKLTRDCTNQAATLQGIHAMHQGRTGPIYDKSNPNSMMDNLDLISIMEQYMAFVNDTQNIILPSAFELQDTIYAAMEKATQANASQSQQAATIPTI